MLFRSPVPPSVTPPPSNGPTPVPEPSGSPAPVPSGAPTPVPTGIPTATPTTAPSSSLNPALRPLFDASKFSLVNNLQFSLEEATKTPIIRLSDDRIFQLMPLDTFNNTMDVMPADKYAVPDAVKAFQFIATPATVDHRKYQTAIRNQGGRNTCVSFALMAALEAAYVRKDPVRYKNLDLSEQYANYLQKMVHLKLPRTTVAGFRENSLGRWGFSNSMYMAPLFARLYGVQIGRASCGGRV